MSANLSPTLQQHYQKADRIMLGVLWLMFVYSLGLAFWNGTWGQALLVGGGTAVVMGVLNQLISGQRLLRCVMGAAYMVMAALHINQAGGMMEMHFSIFVLMAFLVYYRDWLPIAVAALVIAVHHLSFFALQGQGVDVVVLPSGSWPIIFLHAMYVVAESAILIYLAIQTHAEAVESAALMQAAEKLTEKDDEINLVCRSSAQGKVSLGFNHFLGTLDELVGEVIKDTQSLKKMGDSLLQTTAHVSSGAEQQQGEIIYMSSAMLQMSTAIDEVAGHADGAA
ncbi:methyl-accepting chemotaxis protein, partial [Pseudomonas gessardii]